MTTRRPHRDAPWSVERCAMRERVSAFVDHEVSEIELVAVRRHLECCSTCRDFVAFSRGAQEMARRSVSATSVASVSPSQLSAAVRTKRRPPGGLHRRLLGLAAALLVGVATGAIGMEVALHDAERREADDAPPPIVFYAPKIAPGKPLDPDYVRYFETAPKPPMVFPVIWVIEPLPPDPSFRWAGLESGQSYPEGYRLEVVQY